jgi:2-C-methyl-D-erythritol 4-phosphate cytidylyltransferase
MTQARYFALIPAAGIGARMGATLPKQYLPLAGKPMLRHALDTFAASPWITYTVVVVSPGDAYIEEALVGAPYPGERFSVLRQGGATRRDTVLNGLLALRGRLDDADWVLVHDAARPGLTADLIERLIGALAEDAVGGLLALPVADTLKRAAAGRAAATVAREGLWAAQTPQMFRYALLRRALEQAENVTDEAGAIEALGLQPRLVEGSARNFKVTLPHDAELAEYYLNLKGRHD